MPKPLNYYDAQLNSAATTTEVQAVYDEFIADYQGLIDGIDLNEASQINARANIKNIKKLLNSDVDAVKLKKLEILAKLGELNLIIPQEPPV